MWVYAVTGANGSGKSTFFEIIMACNTNLHTIGLHESINVNQDQDEFSLNLSARNIAEVIKMAKKCFYAFPLVFCVYEWNGRKIKKWSNFSRIYTVVHAIGLFFTRVFNKRFEYVVFRTAFN